MTSEPNSAAETITRRGSTAEVFAVFLRLGLTSFGGPIAHLGYFHEEFVVRRRWLDEKTYVDLVALSQFLPGPASSKVGIFDRAVARGLSRCARGVDRLHAAFGDRARFVRLRRRLARRCLHSGWLHGLMIAAVAVVAQAVLAMMRALAPDRARATLAVVATVMVLALPPSWGQFATIVFGGLVGLVLLRAPVPDEHPSLPHPVSRTAATAAVILFLCAACRLAAAHRRRAQSCAAIVRRVLSRRLAGVRRRSCGAAATASLRGAARLGRRRRFSRRLRRGTGGARTAVHVLRLSRNRHAPVAEWLGGSDPLPGRHVPPRLPLDHRSAAVLGRIASALVGAGDAARRQCRRGRVVARRALPPGLDLGDHNAGDFALVAAGFLLLFIWKTPPWLVVVFCAIGGEALAHVP